MQEEHIALLGQTSEGVWAIETYAYVSPGKGNLRVTARYTCVRPGEANADQNLELRVTGQAPVRKNGPNSGIRNHQTLSIDSTVELPKNAPVTIELRRMNTSADEVSWERDVSFAW